MSKHWLNGYLAGSGKRLRATNDPAGLERLVGELADSLVCLVVMEASGGYERIAHRELTARGVPTAIVIPKRWHGPGWDPAGMGAVASLVAEEAWDIAGSAIG